MNKLSLTLLACGALLRAGTVSVEITSPGNVYATPQIVTGGGYYIGPYTLSVNGVTLLALCVDFSHDSGAGYTWSAYETPIAPTGMNGTYVYQNNAANPSVNAITFQRYEEEAYLFNQIAGTSDPATRIAIQDAAWNLTDAAFSLIGNLSAQNWVAAAQNPVNYQHVNLTDLDILSDVTGLAGGQQEFIVDPASPSNVPEPASIGFVAIALGLAWLSRRQVRLFGTTATGTTLVRPASVYQPHPLRSCSAPSARKYLYHPPSGLSPDTSNH